ncbi:MAG TPA: transketolase C-terminal domain-containing protein [Thermoplasmata archaeon]|nr:transketolase C-terminal domain-containing protein [Thermoplasmata archaeon]
MSPVATQNVREALDRALVEGAASDPEIVVVDADYPRAGEGTEFQRRFPERFFDVRAEDPSTLATSARLAGEGRTVVARALAVLSVGRAYHTLRGSICEPRADVKLMADPGRARLDPERATSPMIDDIGIVRGLPSVSIVCPADGPETAAAARALVTLDGPAYLRVPGESLPTLTDGSFELGRSAELRAGSDLAILAIGRPVARALETAEELGRAGISARVLDFASLKPFDERALLRAARETGAILTLEDHSVVSGLGALVAAATAEEYPVPVRRMGAPDLFPEELPATSLKDPFGLDRDRCLEEAYELLQRRGKVQ